MKATRQHYWNLVHGLEAVEDPTSYIIDSFTTALHFLTTGHDQVCSQHVHGAEFMAWSEF